jgi:long-chain acyl-CoA synthetase
LKTASETILSPTDFPNLSALHRATCAALGPLPALRFKRDGVWRHLTWDDYRREADHAAAGLVELGVKPGDRVAILSENRWEWLAADHAILSTGAADVPIHAPSMAAQVEYQLAHSGASGVVVSTPEQWAKVESVRSRLPELRFVIAFEPIPRPEGLAYETWDSARQRGRRAGEPGRRAVAEREAAIGPGDLATIIYTSGTTNRPKGVMLSQGNLVTNSLAGVDAYGPDCTKVWLNWLPFSHVFARLVDHYTTTRMGVTMALARSSATVMDDIREIHPSYFSTVPRLLEKCWDYLAAVPREERAAAARRMFGGRLVHISSGGAPLPAHVATELRGVGIVVLEGYGLTESSPIISFNQTDHCKIGTVGPPIPGVEVKIAPDGEVLTRGPHVMLGYWRDPAATAEAIRDGWLHTGDLGSVDADGFLSITGRKKDLIVTAGGKNIAPAALEALLIQDPFIEQALVYGDARPFVVAIIVPTFDLINEAVRQSGGAFSTEGDIVTDPTLLAWFQDRVDAALRDVSPMERARKIVVLNHPLTLESDELTVTQKVRRTAVFRHYQKHIDALYEGPSR